MVTAEWPNQSLQRTAPCVTALASTAAIPPVMQVPRRTQSSINNHQLFEAVSSTECLREWVRVSA